MGILDSIVEWIATQIMNLLDLVTGSVLGALGCDMSTFLRYFPAAETLYEVFVAIAVGFILLNLVWQLFKNFGLGVGLSAEDPIYEKVRYCHQFNEVANTNIQRVFELILKTAVKNRVPQKDMPAKIFIISDMEFDYCTEDCSLTNFEYAQRLFEEHGYQLPEVMFWNVASRNQQQPVKINDQGVALVSGCNPRIFSMLKAGILSPYAFMMDVLGSERYAAIVA